MAIPRQKTMKITTRKEKILLFFSVLLILTLSFLMFFSKPFIDYPYSYQTLKDKHESLKDTIIKIETEQQRLTRLQPESKKKKEEAEVYEESIREYERSAANSKFNLLLFMAYLENETYEFGVELGFDSENPSPDHLKSSVPVTVKGQFPDIKDFITYIDSQGALSIRSLELISDGETVTAKFSIEVEMA